MVQGTVAGGGGASFRASWSSFSDAFRHSSYRLLGRHLEGMLRGDRLAERLKQAGASYSAGVYVSMVAMVTVLVALVSLLAYLLVFRVLLPSSGWLLYVLLLMGITAGATVAVFPAALNMRISNRRSELEGELSFMLSEMSILASTGIAPIEIMRKMAARRVSPAMQSEFKKVLYKIDIEGKDLITALGEAAKECPSNTLRETLWDLSNMIHQGADLDSYLRIKSDEVMKYKRAIQKEFIEKLSNYANIYISLVLITVLLLSITAFLIDVTGSSLMGLDGSSLLLMLAYGVIPLSILVVGMMISFAFGRTE